MLLGELALLNYPLYVNVCLSVCLCNELESHLGCPLPLCPVLPAILYRISILTVDGRNHMLHMILKNLEDTHLVFPNTKSISINCLIHNNIEIYNCCFFSPFM